jgi:hypothetical protein
MRGEVLPQGGFDEFIGRGRLCTGETHGFTQEVGGKRNGQEFRR